nr:unnamed protein product [Digitaria exilis]
MRPPSWLPPDPLRPLSSRQPPTATPPPPPWPQQPPARPALRQARPPPPGQARAQLPVPTRVAFRRRHHHRPLLWWPRSGSSRPTQLWAPLGPPPTPLRPPLCLHRRRPSFPWTAPMWTAPDRHSR